VLALREAIDPSAARGDDCRGSRLESAFDAPVTPRTRTLRDAAGLLTLDIRPPLGFSISNIFPLVRLPRAEEEFPSVCLFFAPILTSLAPSVFPRTWRTRALSLSLPLSLSLSLSLSKSLSSNEILFETTPQRRSNNRQLRFCFLSDGKEK
jgi:hypothetical protein